MMDKKMYELTGVMPDGIVSLAYTEDGHGRVQMQANEYVTKTVQILAKRRSGKSYLGGLIAEQLLSAKIPIVIIDPISAHWGIKEMFPIILFGNPENSITDIPIPDEPKSFEAVATSIASYLAMSTDSAIIDISHMTESHQHKFSLTFFKILYKLNNHRRHVFVEEADIFGPQNPPNFPDVLSCLHQFDTMVRRGGSKGIGTTIITQRPALVSKNILSQSDLTIVLNTQDTRDLKAVMDTITDDEITKPELLTIRKTIKRLAVGEAFFYSPQWLKIAVFGKVLPRRSYHAGSTLGDSDYREMPVLVTEEIPNLESVRALIAKQTPDQPEPRQHKIDKGLLDSFHKAIDEKDSIIKKLNMMLETKDRAITDLTDACKNMQNEMAFTNALTDTLVGKVMERINLEGLRTEYNRDTKTLTLRPDPERIAQLKKKDDVVVSTSFTEDTLIGRILYLMKVQGWAATMTIAAIHTLIDEYWEIPKSERPHGANAVRFRRKLTSALHMLSKRPYEFIEITKDGYTPNLKSLDRINVEK